MNKLLPDVGANFSPEHADTFHRDLHPTLERTESKLRMKR
jgi:hypothetical protein